MPSTEPLTDLGVREAASRIAGGALSAVALVEACLARIRALEPDVQAWVHLEEPGALAAARERDAEARAGRVRGPLHGVPIGVKDIIHVAGMPTTAGARPWAHTRPAEDAAVVARLRAAGAIVLGKTTTTQFAYRDPAPTRNPWNLAHTPGGSSSGSGAAVAARMVPAALGTQTVGSVLRPAAFCGIVGLKGAHGDVPIDGVIPLAWSLDHVGVLARSAADAGTLLAVMAGTALEPETVTAPVVALPRELLRRASPEVAGHVERAAEMLARAGARVSEIALPAELGTIHEVGAMVLAVEAATFHETTFARHGDAYGPGLRSLVESGLKRGGTEYVRAQRARLAFREAVIPVLAGHDALLSPTAPTTAPAGLAATGDASLCAPWSSAGVPAISLPSGLDAAGLPLAVQLVQAPGRLPRLLGVAAWCERVLGFAARPGA